MTSWKRFLPRKLARARLAALALGLGFIGEAGADLEWEYSAARGWNLDEGAGTVGQGPYEGDPDSFGPYYGGFANAYPTDYDESPGIIDYHPDSPGGDNAAQEAQFQGRIDGFQRVNLNTAQGDIEDHLFVRIRLRNNKSRLVSIGSNVDLNQLNLQRGSEVEVFGRTARVDGKKVLIADSIRVGERSFRIMNKNMGDSVTSSSDQSSSFVIEGILARQIQAGSTQDESIIYLEMRSGEIFTVDLEEIDSFEELNFKQGDQITITGERREMDGRFVIVANEITVSRSRRTKTD